MDTLRYQRNLGAITPEEQEKLRHCRVFVAGCGGLGGYLAEFMARLGVGHITVADGDRFDATNLNRQLLALPKNLGQPKAAAAKLRLEAVNPHVLVTAAEVFVTPENAQELLAGHDLVLDGLDSVGGKRMLCHACARLGIPMIHGAVEGWFGQITVVLPGDDTLSRLYPGGTQIPTGGTLSFAPAMIASIQAAEGVKLLLGKQHLLRGKVLFADLLSGHFDILPI